MIIFIRMLNVMLPTTTFMNSLWLYGRQSIEVNMNSVRRMSKKIMQCLIGAMKASESKIVETLFIN